METDGPGKCERTAKAATNRVGRDCDSGNRNFVGDATRRFEESSRWSRGRARPTRTAYVSRRLGDGTGTGTGTRQNEALRARTDCSAATDGPTQRKRRPTPRPTTKGTWRRRFLRAHPPPPHGAPATATPRIARPTLTIERRRVRTPAKREKVARPRPPLIGRGRSRGRHQIRAYACPVGALVISRTFPLILQFSTNYAKPAQLSLFSRFIRTGG